MKSRIRRVIVFVRYPLPGYVKTRLAAVIGTENACTVYRAFVSDLTETLSLSGVPYVFAFDPPEREQAVMKWLGGGQTYLPQRGRDVGERMEHAFRDVFVTGVDDIVLIGSDVPDLSPGRVGEAFRMLTDWDAVIGPARDGGYYLIGFRREAFFPDVFRSIRWGTQTVFRDTMDLFRACGTKVGVAGRESDIDTAEGLRDLVERRDGCGSGARRTRSLLLAREDILEVVMKSARR